MYWTTFGWPSPNVTAVTLINKNLLICSIQWEPLNITKLMSYILLVMIIIWLYFGGILWQNLYLSIFFYIWDGFFFKVKHYWTYLKNGWSDWCETKKRFIGWILGELCDLDLWPQPWPWFLRSNFKRAVSQELLSDWCETKRKQIN